ncbi:MAG: hypothetical protein V7L21_21365 [Nostoc sp.]|uniref:pPIWI_RE_Z domain-containing protein n=1 Tax=Nostoc sp. TaxID=1180 RepID=UPI002FF68CB3
MREIISWRKDLCKKLRNSDELKDYVASSLNNADAKVRQQEIKRLAQLIADVELGLTLLQEVAPEEPATSVEALLKGYRFPVEQLQSDRNWQLIQNARFYLIQRKGRQWLRVLQEYINLPEIIRIYSLEKARNVPQLIPSSIYPTRLEEIYRPTLLKTPQHRQRKVNLATEGRWYAKISQKGNSPVEVPIDIPKEVANIAPSSVVSLHRTRTQQNPPCSVTHEELILAAQEMDDKLSQFGQQENYRNRLENILFQLYDAESDNFHQGNQLNFEGLIHIVGLLNVGKSTLLEILIYYFAKQGYRCGLMVNDVATAVRLASLFCHKLEIPAAPVLGSKRQEQLTKVYEPILKSEGQEVTKGGMHPAWRWFSPVCPLLALVQSEDKWEFGNEPCHKLYEKVPVVENDNSDDEDFQESDYKQYTCPFYYKCPRHHLEHDIATALVWIFTPASFIHTRVPRQGFEQDLTFAEAVYRECKYLFVDEADRVQIQFDEEFAPDEVLVDASGKSFLNKLGLNLATIYNSDRGDMAGDRFVAWTSAHYHTQNATNRIYHLLLTHSKLVAWLGPLPFTGRSLFARIIRDLVDPPNITVSAKPKLTRQQIMEERRKRIIEADLAPTEQRRRRKQMMDELDGFLQYPLNRRRGGELSDLALTILTAENDRQALAEITPWCERWLENHNIFLLDEAQFEELIQNLQFAILTTILDNRLGFLVDNLSDLGRVINQHDLNQDLLHRPPKDFLPVLPESPVGNILGFLYKQERSNKNAGKLDYFRYVGVGRALLLNFPKLFAVDDWDGPHTVLISGTSYAPGSPAYHISIKPTVLLQPRTGEAGIAESQFFFSPKQNREADYIALSGLPPARRKLAAKEMVEAMCHSARGAESFLDRVFQDLAQRKQQQPEWWNDRDRILIVVGSYEESEWVASILQSRYRFDININDDGIATLRRDNAPAHLHGIPRSEIRNLQHLPTQIVVAPLMALERGHNILNAQGKAAFGAVLFLNRPMPIPDNWQSTVQQLNAWALKHEKDSTLYEEAQSTLGNLTLTQVADIFYQNAAAEMVNLNYTAWSFKQLTKDERSVLCWTQLVSIWQIIGRLVRGGVPAVVHFIDVKFAPNSAIGEQDSESTSLLVAIIKVLEPYIEGEDVLARSLYGPFLNALQQMKQRNLNYD